MSLTITLSDQQAASLQAKAEAEGLPSVEALILKLAEPEPNQPVDRPLQTAAGIILDSMREIPPDIMAAMPVDGASQHDLYIYGCPKRDV